MSLSFHFAALFCVALIAAGQVLFKLSAQTLASAGTILDTRVMSIVLTAFAIYAGATLIWIALLQYVPLGRLYPYMALSFVLVALASWAIFAEPVSVMQMAGLGLLVAGFLVIAASG